MAQAVRRLWAELDTTCGTGRAHAQAEPHMTLVVLLGPPGDRQGLVAGLEEVAATHPPFQVTGAGYGIFTGRDHESVLHLCLTKTPELARLHHDVVAAVEAQGLAVDGESREEFWRPHVNLADQSLTPERVGRAMAHLAATAPRHWTFDISDLSVWPDDGPARKLALGRGSRRKR